MDSYKINFQNRLLVLIKMVILFTRGLPKTIEYQVIQKQLIRCVSSVGANYSAACRARSRPDYIHKLHIVEEECDETIYWMQLLGNLLEEKTEEQYQILDELNQVLSVIIATLKSLKTK